MAEPLDIGEPSWRIARHIHCAMAQGAVLPPQPYWRRWLTWLQWMPRPRR